VPATDVISPSQPEEVLSKPPDSSGCKHIVLVYVENSVLGSDAVNEDG
jgi:hypothetical protein